jgi:hypothetical protein
MSWPLEIKIDPTDACVLKRELMTDARESRCQPSECEFVPNARDASSLLASKIGEKHRIAAVRRERREYVNGRPVWQPGDEQFGALSRVCGGARQDSIGREVAPPEGIHEAAERLNALRCQGLRFRVGRCGIDRLSWAAPMR